MNDGRCKNDRCGAPLSRMRSDAVWCSRACAMDQKRRDRANAGRTRSGPSGIQLSYSKARRNLIERLAHFPSGERLIDDALTASLSDRQRQRLAARTT